MRKCVSYCMTRNIYSMVIPSMKSLLAHTNVDTVYLLTEDDDIGIELPDKVKVINVSGQQYFKKDSPNFYNRFTWMVMMRMALPFVLADADRVLSLDLDTIVQADISELWDLNMDDKYIAGAKEDRMSTEMGYSYINCGVMMMNLKKLREDGMAEKIIHLLNTKAYRFNEQDCMNETLTEDQKLIISPAFNYGFFNQGAMCVPSILHFAAHGKSFNGLDIVNEWRNKDWGEILK